MPITAVDKNLSELTLTVVADFPVSRTRLWDAYADPRQLEKFWGPPTYPATFTRHDMYPGGRSNYYMTGPEGDIAAGYWEFTAVDLGRSFEVTDGFASADGEPNSDLPTMRVLFQFTETQQGSRLTTTTYFDSAEDLEQLIDMGMEEGMREAMGQIDQVVTDLAAFAAERSTEAQLLDDTTIRITRIIRGTVDQVWQAHHDPAILQRWLLGPDGWTMPVCEVSDVVGDTYRYEWVDPDGSGRFGFTGEVLEIEAPHRAVTSEHFYEGAGDPSPDGTVNEMTLTPVDGGTLLSLVVRYQSTEQRDMVLATGMTDGMETSYARLEREVFGTSR